MILTILFTTLSTLFFYLLLEKTKLIKSKLFQISFSWFLGQYSSTFAIFIFASFLQLFTSNVLFKSSLLCISYLIIGLFLLRKDILPLLFSKLSFNKVIIIGICAVFSVLFFTPHLSYKDNTIYTSPTYWDFNVHFPIIQNFVYGDNFPPQNESFAGMPMTYHFFFDLLTAIYAGFGLQLVNSINFVSITALCMMLFAIIGFSEEIFKSMKIGIIAVILTLTSSSLHFTDYLIKVRSQPFLQILIEALTNNYHPYFFSYLGKDYYGYNGTMFNMFYFLAERQLIMAVLYFIVSGWIFYKRKYLSSKLLIVSGIFMGLFFQWHLFVTISVLTTLIFLLISGKNKKQTFYILLSFGGVFALYYLYSKSLINSSWFYPEVTSFPKINLTFATTPDGYFYSPLHTLQYYMYAYGLKLPLILICLYYLWKKNKNIFWLFISIIIPSFILVNTIQLSPLSVYDNHKWLRPMNIFIDICTAYIVYIIFFYQKKLIKQLSGVIIIIILTLSGFLELMPFINSNPTNVYASYPSEIIEKIRASSPPQSTFLSLNSKEIHLAGRKLFLGNPLDEPGATSFLDSALFNKIAREKIIQTIYNAKNINEFCNLIIKNKIDFIQFDNSNKNTFLYKKIAFFPQFSSYDEKGQLLVFINGRKKCEVYK